LLARIAWLHRVVVLYCAPHLYKSMASPSLCWEWSVCTSHLMEALQLEHTQAVSMCLLVAHECVTVELRLVFDRNSAS
jgi:hypothetical protein